MRDLTKVGRPDRYVGTSKTIRSLARMCGAAPSADGPYVRRSLDRDDLRVLVPRLASMSSAQRRSLPGVSEERCRQVLAGALVIEAVMDIVDIERLDVCPWRCVKESFSKRLISSPRPDLWSAQIARSAKGASVVLPASIP